MAIGLALLAWMGWMLAQAAGESGLLEVGKFSTAAPGAEFPDNWKPLTFRNVDRHTTYALVRDGESVVVRAESQGSASGLIRQIAIDPKAYPVVRWQWKVATRIEKSDVTTKTGDDYPARLYITFQYNPAKASLFDKAKYEALRLFYGEYPPAGALNYIWANREPVGTLVRNAYTDHARMIVVENGHSPLNQWLGEERNVVEDYRRAFGVTAQAVPMISGVAIMTDTDNTGESATAYFGDIVFKPFTP